MKSTSQQIKELRDNLVYTDYIRLLREGNSKTAIYEYLRKKYYICSELTLRGIIKRKGNE